MKRRWYISLLLLCVYLFATAAPATVSLTCKCVAMHRVAAYVCCTHCAHMSATSAAQAAGQGAAHTDVAAPCCGNHHSTEINLYTGSGEDNVRTVKCAVLELPAALASACPTETAVLALADKIAERRAPFVCRGFVRCAGLRAPPVLA